MPDPTAERPAEASPGGDFVQSLARGLAVIRAFGGDSPELTLSEVARISGLTRAAARRFLLTLTALGYVRTDGRLFALRPRVLELGYAYLSSMGLADLSQPHMEVLSTEVHESCSLSVLDGSEIAYVARVPTRRIMAVAINVGTRFPAYATSMGRVLLADQDDDWLEDYLGDAPFPPITARTVVDAAGLRRLLTKVRAQGWCFVDQELEIGLRSLAVGVRDSSGAVVAAMNVSMSASRSTVESARREILPALRACAAAIEADLAAAAPGAVRTGRRAGTTGSSATASR